VSGVGRQDETGVSGSGRQDGVSVGGLVETRHAPRSVAAETGYAPGAAPEPEILVEGLGKRYGRREALRDVSFAVERGGFLAVFGPNGAGKTTALRVLAGLATATTGRVRVAGADVREDPLPVRRAVGFISHNPLLYPDLTAYENLRFFADMYGVGVDAAARDARIAQLLDRVELPTRRNDTVRTFSRGMRQRLAIARAILHAPRVLLLDEPHAGLDARAVGILDGLLAEIRGDHTFVMVTHSLDHGLAAASGVLLLDAGRVVLSGPCDEGGRDALADALRARLRGVSPEAAEVHR
jgi:heme exporter protein A